MVESVEVIKRGEKKLLINSISIRFIIIDRGTWDGFVLRIYFMNETSFKDRLNAFVHSYEYNVNKSCPELKGLQ